MKRETWAVVNLGASYGIGDPEPWPSSLRDCRDVFRDYLNGDSPEGLWCPCVEDDAEAFLFSSKEAAEADLNNAWGRLYVGPRGGVRFEYM